MTAFGKADVTLTGNGLANILTGNSGANWIDGGDGDDSPEAVTATTR